MAKPGRPTKFKSKYCKEIIDFFSTEPYKEVEVTFTDKKGNTTTKTELRANDLPTFEGFAEKIGVNGDTIVEWAKEDKKHLKNYPGFSASYKRAKELQKNFLIQNGLMGLYSTAFAIFTAKNITDMRDKQEMEHTGKGGIPLAIKVVSYNKK